MNIEDYDIPSESREIFSFEGSNDQMRVNHIHKLKELTPRYAEFLLHLFVSKTIKQFSIEQYGNLSECLKKLFQVLGDPTLKTRILSKMQQFLQINAITDIHIQVLKLSIETYNYRIGYKLITSQTYFQHQSKNQNIYCEYFYYAGIIYQAMKHNSEALNCYKIASSLPGQSQHKQEAKKMEILLGFRLGLRPSDASFGEFQTLTSVINQSMGLKFEDENYRTEDPDLVVAVNEWKYQAQIFTYLKEQEQIYKKVTFDQIQLECFQNNNDDYLIDLLVQINEIHNMFLINEKQRYIEFQYDRISYKEINQTLEEKFELINQLCKQ